MRKTTLTFLFIAITLTFAETNYTQPINIFSQRDIAVVGHNLNHRNNILIGAPNSGFSGWNAGGNASFQMISFNPPDSFLKNKITGIETPTCSLVNLLISDAPATISFDATGGAHLAFSGAGGFGVICGADILVGTFSQAVLHVTNNSNSASITLSGNTVNYIPPTNVINNQNGNFSFGQGSLSIAIITERPAVVTPTSIRSFFSYSNVVFGARFVYSPDETGGPQQP